jgi:predicted DNA-binding transcriptional regulator AlpA
MSPRAWMKRKKLSCSDVARLIGTSKMNVWRHINGKNTIPDHLKLKYVKESGGAITLSELCSIKGADAK